MERRDLFPLQEVYLFIHQRVPSPEKILRQELLTSSKIVTRTLTSEALNRGTCTCGGEPLFRPATNLDTILRETVEIYIQESLMCPL